MITIINATKDISSIYENGDFQIEKWEDYINEILPDHKEVFLNDMNEVLRTGDFSFEKDYLPVLNLPFTEIDKRTAAISSFELVTKNLDAKIKEKYGRVPDVTIVLYLGLCNGAGWTMTLDNTQYILLGIEKMIELDWCSPNEVYGLIYHELGHIYQMQFGKFANEYSGSDKFLWQLFTEGIAMNFEQKLIGDPDFFHQNKDNWLNWCEDNEAQLKLDFSAELPEMTYETQRYFGDWVNYEEHCDTGYYLAARFVQWIGERFSFDEMIKFDITNVRKEWENYQSI